MVESWRGRGTEEINDGALYIAVVPGSSVVAVATRPGYFGHEWIVAARVKRDSRSVIGVPPPTGPPPAPPSPVPSASSDPAPGTAEWHYRWARLYLDSSAHYDEGLAAARQAIALDPHHFRAYQLLDKYLIRQRAYDEIIAHWDRFIALEPQHAEAHLERAGTYHHKGDRARARAGLERACELGSQKACELRRRH